MSLVHDSLTWCRHNLSWSNSRLSWQERLSTLAILGSAAVLWVLSPWMLDRPVVFFAAWLTWLIVAIERERSGRLQLFGPVLYYDMIRTARRNRYAVVRLLYAGFLLLLLYWVYSLMPVTRNNDRQQMARLAGDFFEWFMLVQLTAVVLLTPSYVGGAIADEKERRTLEFILATDLRSQEVILSKLGSRLANLSLFLITGLPILSLLQFLGGIDPNLVLMGFAVTGLTMLGVASTSLFYSVIMRRPRDAIGLTYLICISFIAVSTTLSVMQRAPRAPRDFLDFPLWFGADPPTVSSLATLLSYGNPLALIIDVKIAGMSGSLATALPTLLWHYASFHLVLSAICLGWSIFRLRPVGLKQTVGREIKAKDARNDRPPVGELPLVWKETLEGNQRLGLSAWLSFVPLALLTVGIGVYIAKDLLLLHLGELMTGTWMQRRNAWDNTHQLQQEMNVWARLAGTGVASVLLLWTAVRASTSISGERDKQTLDALITTQLDSDAILGAKLFGSLLSVRLGLLWLGSIMSLSCLAGGLHPLAMPITLGAWLLYACFFAMLGLWFSMVCRSATRATVTTVMVALAVSIGHWLIWLCLGPLLYFGHSGRDTPGEFLMKFQTGMTPPAVLALSMFSYDEIASDFGHNHAGEIMAYCMLGLILWGSACFALWFGMLSPRFRQIMRREPGLPE
jgi:ABC-type transport system involved in multi-copper enzyme maturation permease subunit